MKTQTILYLIFVCFFPLIMFSQTESTNRQEQSKQDSLNRLLYKTISQYASSPQNLSSKIEKLVAEGAKPNGVVVINEKYRKYGTYIPIIKDFYKDKYRTYTYKTTPFHAAVGSGNIQIVEKLIELGADVNIPADKDDYPVKLAAYKKDKNMILFLLNNRANVKHIDLSKIDDIELIKILTEKGADVSTANWNFFLNDIPVLKQLIELNPKFTGVRLNFEDLFANNNAFDFLMDNGMPVSVRNSGMSDCPLMFGAVKYGNIYALKKIIATQKVNINAECKKDFNRTPLVIAIDEENLEMIKFLLEMGANPMQKDWTNKISINHTVFSKNPEGICKLLIQYGADLEYKGYFGQTPLMHAVKLDEYIAALAYIKLGANVNARGRNGDSPLSLAIREENIPMLKLLFDNGADPKTKYKGKTLLQYARDEEVSPTVIEFLKNRE